MLGFDSARFEVREDEQRLNFALSIRAQVLVYSYIAIGGGLLAGIGRGLAKGLMMGVLFGGAVFLLNFLTARYRAVNWLTRMWTEAAPNKQPGS